MSSDSRLRLNDAAEQWLRSNDPDYRQNRYLWSTRPTDAMAQKLVPLFEDEPDWSTVEGNAVMYRERGTGSHHDAAGARGRWVQECEVVPAADDRPKKRLRQHRGWHPEAKALRKQGWGYSRIAKKLGVNVSSVHALINPKKA
jgi:hypothetical protein